MNSDPRAAQLRRTEKQANHGSAWLHNPDMLGTALIVFDSEEHAKAAVDDIKPPPGGPTVIDCAVFGVAREA